MATTINRDDDPSVPLRQSQSNIWLLKTGKHSDFTVICGDRQWKAHKAILSKIPFFNAAVDGGFQESCQEKITIEELFQPFEIQWLLEYIYFPFIHLESARRDTPSGSNLETCVRLWQLGDYFQVKDMTEQAEIYLHLTCECWRAVSRHVDTMARPTSFLYDVECAIRRAWSEDLASGPLLREMLAKLCLEFAPYLKHHGSFSKLLEEVPGFTMAFSQQALGTITSSLPLPMPPGGPRTPELQKQLEYGNLWHGWDIAAPLNNASRDGHGQRQIPAPPPFNQLGRLA